MRMRVTEEILRIVEIEDRYIAWASHPGDQGGYAYKFSMSHVEKDQMRNQLLQCFRKKKNLCGFQPQENAADVMHPSPTTPHRG